jgi:hypothetical protein
MDAAEAPLIEEDTRAVGAMIEMILPPPGKARAAKELRSFQGRVVLPTLGLDAGALDIGDADEIFAAAFSAAAAVPILQDRE